MAMPGMVFQKAGAPALRGLLGNQALKNAYKRLREFPEVFVSQSGKVSPFPYKEMMKRAKLSTPMVRKNLTKIEHAITGEPATLIGFRAHGAGGPVPGRGTFYSAYPQGAVPFYGGKAHGNITGKSIDVIKFKNPLVMDGHQPDAMRRLLMRSVSTPPGARTEFAVQRITPKVPESLRKVGRDLLNSYNEATHVEKWYTKADKWIARVAKSLGHDGIVYKGTEEIVDLAGTVTRR
jgi:hypothetical protein